jgi:hypothetical protein
VLSANASRRSMRAHGAGQGKIPCLYFNLHGYLQAGVILEHGHSVTPVETK